jgi:hypothetical protein
MSDDFIRRYSLKSAGCTDAEIDAFDENALSTMFVDAWADYESKKQKDAKRIAKELYKIQAAANDAKPQTLDGPIALKQQDAERDKDLAKNIVTGVAAEVAKLVPESSIVIPKGESGYDDKNREARDRFIYECKKAGLLNREIIKELRKKSKKNWEPLTTDKSITNAVKRYTILTNAPALRPSQGGRPRGGTAK